jgi:hypothetical protein
MAQTNLKPNTLKGTVRRFYTINYLGWLPVITRFVGTENYATPLHSLMNSELMRYFCCKIVNNVWVCSVFPSH